MAASSSATSRKPQSPIAREGRVLSAKRATKLVQKKHRETERLFLAEGKDLVSESPVPPSHLFTEPDEVRKVSTLTTPTGPVGVFPFLDVEVGELLRTSDRIVALHGVQDPGNVGTIIRAAHAFGAGVALSLRCADLYNPKTVRATMGSIFHVPIVREVDTGEFLGEAKVGGFATITAVPEHGEPLASLPAENIVLVVGSEGAGLPEEVVAACDSAVTIASRAASLNVAMAASILLYEAYARVLP